MVCVNASLARSVSTLLNVPQLADLNQIKLLNCPIIQIFGGAGYNQEYPVEKLMRDAKIYQVSELCNHQRTIPFSDLYNYI